MKIGIIVFVLFFFVGMVDARVKKNDSQCSFKLHTRWGYTPVKKVPGLEIQNFQRYVKIKNGSFPVASTTYTRIIESKSSESIDEIVKGIKVGFGKENKWSEKKITNGKLLIGNWKKASRDIRILLFKPSPQEFVIVSSFVRKRYQKSIAGEIELLEKRIIKRNLKSKLSLIDYFISQAQAQFDSFLPSPTTDGTDPYSQLSTDLEELKASLDQVQVESDEWQALLDNFSSEWQVEVDELQELMKTESDEWQVQSEQWQQLMQTQSEAWLERADRGLDIMEKFTDPAHMAVVGFATAAGAALGTLAVNLVVDGIIFGVKSLVDVIFQITANRDRWENFNEAREMWEDRE